MQLSLRTYIWWMKVVINITRGPNLSGSCSSASKASNSSAELKGNCGLAPLGVAATAMSSGRWSWTDTYWCFQVRNRRNRGWQELYRFILICLQNGHFCGCRKRVNKSVCVHLLQVLHAYIRRQGIANRFHMLTAITETSMFLMTPNAQIEQT